MMLMFGAIDSANALVSTIILKWTSTASVNSMLI